MSALAARRLYIVAYCTVAAALAWLILSVAVSGELAARDPSLALRWRPHDPAALDQLAQRALEAGKAADTRSYALESIAHSPHDATAWRLLGQAALDAPNPALARQLFAEAGRLTHRDAALAAWFFEDSVRRRRYADAVEYADVVMRRAPDKQSAMIFRLTALAQDPAAIPAIAHALQRRPNWRPAFFQELAATPANGAVAMELIREMMADGAPLTADQLSGLLNPMVHNGGAQDAYRLWLATIPVKARPTGPVFDPEFTGTPAAAPFGWTLGDKGDDLVELPAPGGKPGLRIEFFGVGAQRLAMQTLMLAPGRYRFETAGRLLEGDEETVRWLIGCRGQAPVLLDLRKGGMAAVSADFDVPADCPTPYLILSTLTRDHDTPAIAVIERADIEKIG